MSKIPEPTDDMTKAYLDLSAAALRDASELGGVKGAHDQAIAFENVAAQWAQVAYLAQIRSQLNRIRKALIDNSGDYLINSEGS